MRYGSPHSSGYGSPENHFIYAYADNDSLAKSGYTSFRYRFRLRPGWGDAWVQLYRNGAFYGTYYAQEGAEKTLVLAVPWGAQSVSVLPLRIGHLSDLSYEDDKVARLYEAVENTRVTLEWTFTPQLIVPPFSDGGYTSNWLLTGLIQGANNYLVQGHNTWGRLDLDLAVVAGTATITLSSHGVPIASGTAPIASAPFTVNFTPQNNSGVYGGCTVANTVQPVANGIIDIKWPACMKILRGASTPPSALVDTVLFTGMNTVRWTEAVELAAGTYYYQLVPVSDTGQDGIASNIISITSIAAPEPPAALAYAGGNAAATSISFKLSATPSATYNAYCATAIGGVANLNAPVATAPAGVPGGAATITLPAITGYPGTAYLILRAKLNGVEERNQNTLALEYDASGNCVAPRPNSPGIALESMVITGGRTAAIKGTYNPVKEAAPATSLKLFIRAPSGSYDYNSPIGAGGILAPSGLIKTATVTYTFPSNGYYYCQMLACTANGVYSIASEAPEALVYVSDEALPAAMAVSAELSRS